MTLLQTIKKHSGKYLTGGIISSGTALLMMKYYTAVFSPADFGIMALYLVMFQYVLTFVSLDMQSGATRLYFDYKDTRRDEYLSTIFWFITFMAVITFIIGLLLMPLISNWIAEDSEWIYIITLVAGIFAVYATFLTRILYNEHKSTSVLKHTIFQTFVNHFSSFAFISFFNLGIFGRMSGQGLGSLLNVLSLLREFFKENLFRLKLTFNKMMAKETFMLAMPTMIASIQNILFIYLDRIFLKHYIGDSAVGIYTLGYMLGQGLSMVYEAISQAMLPKVFNDMNSNYEKAKDELEVFAYKYYLGLIGMTAIISFLSPFIIQIFSNANYSESANVMPFVMASFMMGGFYKIPSLVLGYHKIVWFYPLLSVVAFGTNALLNWILIPHYGVVGAAFAFFVGVFLFAVAIFYISRKYFSNKFNFYSFSLLGLVFLFLIGGFYATNIS
jgi:O-antigen/teichoic acid export membrane protein